MRWSDIPFAPSSRTLRQFAGLWLAFFGAIACWQAFTSGNSILIFGLAVLAVAIGVPGLIKPLWIRPIYVGWMVLTFPIGWTISHILLAIIYYGVFTPIGLVFKLMGRDALRLLPRPNETTYWVPKCMPVDVRSYFKSF